MASWLFFIFIFFRTFEPALMLFASGRKPSFGFTRVQGAIHISLLYFDVMFFTVLLLRPRTIQYTKKLTYSILSSGRNYLFNYFHFPFDFFRLPRMHNQLNQIMLFIINHQDTLGSIGENICYFNSFLPVFILRYNRLMAKITDY